MEECKKQGDAVKIQTYKRQITINCDNDDFKIKSDCGKVNHLNYTRLIYLGMASRSF